ncbi:hypothetical protein GOBAR_DD00723 [Gossypium barbadense]|nr:hypothetical protein GOBAR_DD00723 [Gossypium barbadense]
MGEEADELCRTLEEKEDNSCTASEMADVIYHVMSFVDLQFPNGQLTYVSYEGLTTSAFLPLCGGLLQAQPFRHSSSSDWNRYSLIIE